MTDRHIPDYDLEDTLRDRRQLELAIEEMRADDECDRVKDEDE